MANRTWIKEFTNLYFSANEKDIAKALKLKEMHFPKKLYRYRPAIRENELQGNIYLSHYKELNDPYDSCSVLHACTASEFLNYRKKESQAMMRLSLAKGIDDSTLDNIFRQPEWFEVLVKTAFELRAAQPQTVLDAVESLEHTVMEIAEKITEYHNQRLHEYRIACFTEESSNTSMWNFYANGHSGICLEYDIEDKWKTNIYPVRYTNLLPDILKILFTEPVSPNAMLKCLVHKLNCWNNETEWRLIPTQDDLIALLGDYNKLLSDKGILYPFFKPSKVILGSKISKEDQKRALSLSEKYSIPLQKIRCTPSGLKLSDLNNSDLNNMDVLQPDTSPAPRLKELFKVSESLTDEEIKKVLNCIRSIVSERDGK